MRPTAFSLAALIVTVAGVVLTWRRLFYGMDLQDESYYVLLPWRWVLGDRPFVHEQNLLQFPAMLTYPFVKVFGVVRGNDPTGLMLYTRHLYLLLMIATAAVVFLLLRRLVLWQLALLVASLYVTYIFWATPQLSYNTFALALLTMSAALVGRVVAGFGGPRTALAAGAVMGLAVVAYPSLLALVPFFAVLFAFAQGRRAAAAVAQGAFVHVPDPPGQPTGAAGLADTARVGPRRAARPAALRCRRPLVRPREPEAIVADKQLAGARAIHQLGGSAKALDVAQGVERFIMWRPYLVIAALLIYLVYRRWPRVGRCLLALLPVALWLAGQRALMAASGYVLILCLLAPYLYLFIPKERRETGARLLIGVWAPSLLAGAMTAYTSAAGFVNAAVGLSAGVMVSGLFLAQALAATGRSAVEPDDAAHAVRLAGPGGGERTADGGSGRPRVRGPPALACPRRPRGHRRGDHLLPVRVPAERRGVPGTDEPLHLRPMVGHQGDAASGAPPWTTSNGTSGPSRGPTTSSSSSGRARATTCTGPERSRRTSTGSLRSRRRPARPRRWRTIRKYHVVPTLAVHLMPTTGMTAAEIAAADAGLGYPPTLVRPTYVFYRKPAGDSTAEVIRRLSRP